LDKPVLLADENVHAVIIEGLRTAGFQVISVRETLAGSSDESVLAESFSSSAILITEDSDFGELVFSHGSSVNGVVYLRYPWQEVDAICAALLTVLSSRQLRGSFFTITPKKIRERKIP
jgi:predicted nuclease of predicted toxin-antitoxin system